MKDPSFYIYYARMPENKKTGVHGYYPCAIIFLSDVVYAKGRVKSQPQPSQPRIDFNLFKIPRSITRDVATPLPDIVVGPHAPSLQNHPSLRNLHDNLF